MYALMEVGFPRNSETKLTDSDQNDLNGVKNVKFQLSNNKHYMV